MDDSSPDLSLRLRRGSSDSRDSFYMDFAQGIDSDIEEVVRAEQHHVEDRLLRQVEEEERGHEEQRVIGIGGLERIAEVRSNAEDTDKITDITEEDESENEDQSSVRQIWPSIPPQNVSGISATSGTSGTSKVSAISATSGTSGTSKISKVSAASQVSGTSQVSGISQVSGTSKVSATSKASAASKGSATSSSVSVRGQILPSPASTSALIVSPETLSRHTPTPVKEEFIEEGVVQSSSLELLDKIDTGRNDECMSRLFSALYGTLATVLGAALPLGERLGKAPAALPQLYLLTLYALGALFLTWLRASAACCRGKPTQNRINTGHIRAASVALGSVALLHAGLEVGRRLEEDLTIPLIAGPTARAGFTFLQMHWALSTSRLQEVYTKYRILCRLGLAHLAATNICIWLHIYVEETRRELTFYESITENNTLLNGNEPLVTLDHPAEAHQFTWPLQGNVITNLFQKAAPYLSPAVIQHAVICCALLCTTWGQITKTKPEPKKKFTTEPRLVLRSSHRGLLAGVALLALTVMSVIIFHVLADGDMPSLAVTEAGAVELILQTACSIAALFALCTYKQNRAVPVSKIDAGLLLITQGGALAHSAFTLVAGIERLTTAKVQSHEVCLVTAAAGANLLQTVFQTAVLLTGRSGGTGQLSALLLAGNAASWALGAALRPRPHAHRLQLRHYGPITWTYVTQLATPLYTLYRLHSALLFFKLWRRGQRLEAPPLRPAYM